MAHAVAVLQKDGRLTRCGMQPTVVGDIWLGTVRARNAHLKIAPLKRRVPRKDAEAS